MAIIIAGGYFYYDELLQISKKLLPISKKEKEQKSAVIAGQTTQETPAITSQSGYIEINSTPEEAEVYIDEKSEGMTPLKRELSPGTYRIRIMKSPEYEEMTDVLEIKAGETSSKNYTLALAYILKINTSPEGADVRIDGNYKGKTPIQLELPSSICQLRIEKGEEWSRIDERLTLKPGINSLQLPLKKIRYSLSIKTNPSEASVSIGNKPFGITPVKVSNLFGVCDIKIEKEGYKTIEESIIVESDVEKTYELIKLKVGVGKIRLKVHPYADVLIDGKLIGEVPPILIQEVEEGKHSIEFVSSRLNKKFTVEVEIRTGESLEIRMNMETGQHRIVKISLTQ